MSWILMKLLNVTFHWHILRTPEFYFIFSKYGILLTKLYNKTTY